MSVNDPIADMLTRIRNAVMAGQSLAGMPNSKIKVAIAKILKSEGYIENYQVVDGERPGQKVLRIRLKYVGKRRERKSVITNLERISSPGKRVYTKTEQIPWVFSGLGIAIVSTPKGVMTDAAARNANVGGEVLCTVF